MEEIQGIDLPGGNYVEGERGEGKVLAWEDFAGDQSDLGV